MNTCILCDEGATRVLFTAHVVADKKFSVGECNRCGFTISLPVLSESDLDTYYAPQYYGRRKLVFDTLINRARMRYLAGLLPKGGGAVLDIGCGSGSFLAMMQRTGVRVAGTELPSRKGVDDQKAGIPVAYASVWNAGFPEASFNAVTFWHTLEHMVDPVRYLKGAHAMLAPGGSVVVEVPNMASWQARIGKEHWFHLDVPRHTVHFTPHTVRILLEKTGFTRIRMRYASFFYDVFGCVQTLLNRVTRRQNVLFDVIGGRIRPQDHIRDSAVTVFLLPVVGLVALVLHVVGRFFRASSVMTVCAKRT